MTRPRKTWSSASASRPEDFFLTRKMTREKFANMEEWGRAVHHFRHAGLPGISRRQARIDLHGLGHSDAQRPGLEGAMLSDDRRPLSPATRKCWTKVQWDKYGVVNGVARDPRCEIAWCIAATIPAARWAPISMRRQLEKHRHTTSAQNRSRITKRRNWSKRAFNGFTIGKGHLAEAKAAINSPPPGARCVLQRSPSRAARRQLRHGRHFRARRIAGEDRRREEGRISSTQITCINEQDTFSFASEF